jgi:RND family efflux transporter MFP subunit
MTVQVQIRLTKEIFVKRVLAILLVLCMSFLVSCKKRQKETAAEKPILVEVTAVTQGDVSKEIRFTGSVKANTEVKIYPKISAIIQEMKVSLGDTIKKEGLIAVLESDELRAQAAQAQAALEVVQAKWAQMNVGARSEEIAQAEDLVAKATANLKNAEHNYQRMKVLFEGGTVAKRQFESAELEYTVAKADLNSAQERLDMLLEGATKEDRQALQAQVNQARAALDLARIRLSYTRITSPIDGTISERLLDPGDLAVPTNTLVTIVQMDTVKVIVYVPENQIRFMAPELQAQLTVAAYPGQVFYGAIDTVSPTLNPTTRMFSVEIKVINKDRLLRPGMFAAVSLSVDPHPNAVLVPKEAVLHREQYLEESANSETGICQVNHVFVVEDGTAYMRTVTLGHESDTMVEVCDGVSMGEQVVIRGLNQLNDGDRVTVVKGEGIRS